MQVEAALPRTCTRYASREREKEREREREREREKERKKERGKGKKEREIARTQTGFEREPETKIWNGCKFCGFVPQCRRHETKLSSSGLLPRQIIYCLKVSIGLRVVPNSVQPSWSSDRSIAIKDWRAKHIGPFELSEARRFDFAMRSGIGYCGVHSVRDA